MQTLSIELLTDKILKRRLWMITVVWIFPVTVPSKNYGIGLKPYCVEKYKGLASFMDTFITGLHDLKWKSVCRKKYSIYIVLRPDSTLPMRHWKWSKISGLNMSGSSGIGLIDEVWTKMITISLELTKSEPWVGNKCIMHQKKRFLVRISKNMLFLQNI